MQCPSSLLVLSASTSLLACAPPDVSGDWSGEWRSGVFTGGIEVSLTQEGDTVSGDFELTGTACVGSGSLDGSLDDRDIRLDLANQVGGEVAIDGRVGAADERITGDFQVTGGWCENAEGTVELSRAD